VGFGNLTAIYRILIFPHLTACGSFPTLCSSTGSPASHPGSPLDSVTEPPPLPSLARGNFVTPNESKSPHQPLGAHFLRSIRIWSHGGVWCSSGSFSRSHPCCRPGTRSRCHGPSFSQGGHRSDHRREFQRVRNPARASGESGGGGFNPRLFLTPRPIRSGALHRAGVEKAREENQDGLRKTAR